MTADIAVVGSLHLDIMVRAPGRPRLGETMVGQSWAMKPGGKGGNQAVEAARHGALVAMVGGVGADPFGQRLRENLRTRGVDDSAVVTREDVGSGMSVALVEPSGDYGAIIVSGVNLAIGATDIEAARQLVESARWVMLQNEIPEAANRVAATVARQAGARVMLNAAPARELPSDLLACVDVLVVNALEAEALCGFVVDNADAAARSAQLLTGMVNCAVVTAGRHGVAMARRGGEQLRLPAHEVAVVSTHGAGDAFCGALAARLAGGAAMADALRYANAAAALIVATPDAARHMLRADAVARLAATPVT